MIINAIFCKCPFQNYIHENNIEREDNSSSSSKPSPKSVNLEQSQYV